ncbi:MAG TPA: host attachment protein [Gammaproteobacteria bacterium]|nr:host attachment protein [Gammaproteobacteria bacterium]
MAVTQKIMLVAADRGHARFFSIAHNQEELQELNDLVNADARRPANSLASDRQGRSLNRERGSRAALGRDNLQNDSARRFAHRVATLIVGKLLGRSIIRLFIIADPEFLGMLRSELRTHKLTVPLRFIAKNVTRTSNERIRSYLPKRLWPRRIMDVEV